MGHDPPMRFDVRPLRVEDLPEFLACFQRAIPFPSGPDLVDRLRALLDFEGSFVAVEGDRIVGTLGAYPFDVSTPGGGELSMAGTTVVGVLPTHRRQGVLRAMMVEHMGWARARGFDAVGLWASEVGIYGRFGFGPLTRRGGWTVDTRAVQLAPAEDEPTLRYVEVSEASDRIQACYAAHRRARAGALTRSPAWWARRRFLEDPARHAPFGAIQLVEATRDGRTVGYAQYRRRSRWDEGRARDVLSLEELVGDPATRRALWRLLLDIDLVTEIGAYNLPPDDELHWLFGQNRGARVHVEDALWLAPLKLDRLFSSRRYPLDGRIALEVAGQGRYALEISGGEGHLDPVTRDAELHLPFQTLPALAWGATPASTLAAAGALSGSTDAIARADALLASAPRPWCPERF